jgi:nucleoside-diphosphate-sugar epimerase
MRIFVAGATGAVGRRLVPKLVRAGHEVVGSTTSGRKVDALRQMGAEPVVMDALDATAVRAAVETARPEVVVHELTALNVEQNIKNPDQTFALTNRLRTEAVDHLIVAARAAGAKRFVSQSFTGWNNPRTGVAVKDETDGLDPDPVPATRKTMAAFVHLEKVTTEAADLGGIALRYGLFYGPGTGFAQDGEMVELVRKRKLPVVGGGTGVWSFVHIDDAATATMMAIEAGVPGVYNIVDNEPARVSEWLPYLAEVIGAKTPMKLPGWLAKPMLGEAGMSMMTKIRGSSNLKARTTLGWQPAFPSWRQGFRHGLS